MIAIAPANGISGNQVDALLNKTLQERGYRLAKVEEKSAEVHHLRYLITKYGGGYALRVTLDGAEATTAFSRMQSGELVAGAPLTIREAVR